MVTRPCGKRDAKFEDFQALAEDRRGFFAGIGDTPLSEAMRLSKVNRPPLRAGRRPDRTNELPGRLMAGSNSLLVTPAN